MKKKHSLFLGLMIVLLSMNSCLTQKKLTYLQYSERYPETGLMGTDSRATATPIAYKLMPYDILYIRVITPDPQWAEMFNTVAAGAGGTVTAESAALLGYPIDEEGNIEIPFAGKLKVAGKNLSEVKADLELVLKNYVTDAAITVRMVNNFVSIIGEVRAPGRYPLTKDRVNIFEALSMSGDLGEFSNRQKVQLIRPSPYGPVIKEFSLNDRSILKSEFFYILPNDIIYAQPMKGKTFQMNSSIYSLFLSSITTILVILTFVGIPAN